MKRFFSKASTDLKSALQPSRSGSESPTSSSNPTAPHTTGLQPKYLIPPVPHPSPHSHVALLVTSNGLLLRPHIPGQVSQHPPSHVRISWNKPVKVEEISGEGDGVGLDWTDSVIVYGIVGVLELYSAGYLLVVTGRHDVGNLFEPTHAVYGVKSVTAIPLVESRARITLNTLASRNLAHSRPSLISSNTMDSMASPADAPDPGPETDNKDSAAQYATDSRPSPARVQFSPNDQVKVMTPLAQRSFKTDTESDEIDLLRSASPSPSDTSGASTPSMDNSPTTPIAKALASRLSFWSRLSKRSTLFPASPSAESDATTQPMTLPDEQDDLDTIVHEAKGDPAEVLEGILDATAPAPVTQEEKHSELEEKIVRECIREFTKGGMYFAYNFDITRSLQHKQDQIAKSQKHSALLADLMPSKSSSDVTSHEGEKANPLSEPNPTLPLWRRVDRQYWWNEWLSKPFVDAGLHPYVLPIMQGYYQIASFNILSDADTPEETLVDYAVVSRRSRDRAGLRYQRRGVDDDAHAANFVETETVMRVKRQGIENIFSYVQIRGSIPLFWTQTGYGLKPPPLLAPDRTHEQNLDAARRHFEKTIPLYGPHAIVNLAEQQGREGALTQAYKECMTEMGNKDAQYNEYDFHSETKGMKYENISKLIDSMDRTFEHQGFLWISDNTVMSQQKGVFRVNCIDCLDRTNVVQSAFARHVLNTQLEAVALHNPSLAGKSEIDTVFNDVWANNGDAISRAYAGTSALKGDFTRTGKRDLSGMLNDGVNSLARMYSSTFSDWFCQAVIDFMLGNRTMSVFSEFLLKLQSSDPRDMIRLSKIRAEAIATSVERVLLEGERLLAGWTLFAPEQLNTKMGDKFEEKVLLLTARALYVISYDYTLEKVKIYTRVPLGDIIGISKGAYILSPLEEASRDPVQNAGFVVSWVNTNQVTRVTSYSVRNSLEAPSSLPTSPVVQSPPLKPTAGSLFTEAARSRISLTLGARKPSPTVLSNLLANPALGTDNSDQSFAAFKMLPIDPARIRRGSSLGGTHDVGGYLGTQKDHDLSGVSSCKEAVDLIVDSIRRACEDVGSAHGEFVTEADVVSVAEAQRVTSMYAKMEYGVKRLLWLGG